MYNVHDNLKDQPVEVLKAISSRDRLPYAIMLMNFEHDLNIGNCIRSAHLLGVRDVIIFGKRKIDSRSTVGAHNYINLIKVGVDMDVPDAVQSTFNDIMKTMRLSPIYIDKVEYSKESAASRDIESADYSHIIRQARQYSHHDPCLIFGNEATGIHPNTVVRNPNFFHIKQYGIIRSFNVASAASIVMYKTSQILSEMEKKS